MAPLGTRWRTRGRQAAHRLRVAGLARRIATSPDGAAREARLRETIGEALRPGDAVWDVGAARGEYAWWFSESVGSTGWVVAFEPALECRAALEQLVSRLSNVRLVPVALGAEDGGAQVSTAPTAEGRGPASDEDVPVRAGRSLVAEGVVPPDVVRLDVDGSEEAVLRGLDLATCRAVFCEIDFAALVRLGDPNAPERIVDLLEGAGLEVRWWDPSHLVGARPETG